MPSPFEIWLKNPARKPCVMGIINATPDSFSDGGPFLNPATAADQAKKMIEAGAAVIDIGGESTRPGSHPVAENEQIRRVAPVIAAVAQAIAGSSTVISIDTTRAAVVKAAVDAGAALVNDISAGSDDPEMLPLVARLGLPIVLMHMRGNPATMQADPQYADVTFEVRNFLFRHLTAATKAGIDRSNVLLDPGLGFGKTDAHNLTLLRQLKQIAELGQPVLVGPSRKGFIGRVSGDADATDRRFGTAAAVAWSVANGASMVRVHDVAAMAQVVKTIEAIVHGG